MLTEPIEYYFSASDRATFHWLKINLEQWVAKKWGIDPPLYWRGHTAGRDRGQG